MPSQSFVELTDLQFVTDIGTYGPGDVVPDAHILDLKLEIDPRLVLVAADGMEHVFDYDPLVAELTRLARDGHYETQERLMTRIVHACADHPEIKAVEIKLSKTPVTGKTGQLGMRLMLDEQALTQMRQT